MKMDLLIHKDEGSVYGVTVPALPGCFSWGDSIDDALENTKEAVHAHLNAMISEGMPISLTRAITHESASEDDGVWATVDIDMSDFESALVPVR